MASPLLLDGKGTAAQIREELKVANSQRRAAGQRPPLLAAVLVGNDGGSESYVAHKIKACAEVGFESRLLRFSSDISQNELLSVVNGLNHDDQVDGFIVQLPCLPISMLKSSTWPLIPTKMWTAFTPSMSGAWPWASLPFCRPPLQGYVNCYEETVSSPAGCMP